MINIISENYPTATEKMATLRATVLVALSGRGGTRTHDLTDVNRALLPAELRARES